MGRLHASRHGSQVAGSQRQPSLFSQVIVRLGRGGWWLAGLS